MPKVASGFTIERIGVVDGARELAVAPNGDLFVGTLNDDVDLLPQADSTHPGTPHVFATFNNSPAAGVTLGDGSLFVGTQFAVYRIPYQTGDQKARSAPVKLASVRTSGVSSDHHTTSVALIGDTLYASVGSSCNACVPELDDTRATIQRIDLRTGKMSVEAHNIRNAIALTVNPQTETLWAGVAGADDLPIYHPYEIFDAVTSHTAPVNYGWPACYENRRHFEKWPGSCDDTPVPRVVFTAYETPIGAVFYPQNAQGAHAFPAAYRGGAFVTLHGSWHGPAQGLSGYMPPRVAFVPMHGDTPERAANWSDPTTQWHDFVSGYQNGGTPDRIGRPTGVAVGPDGSLFIADDQTGAIYRIRPK
jgi:glucose/arabinose dehydrogenase